MRINTGGPEVVENGHTWLSDRYYVGGNVARPSKPVQGPVPELSRDERWGMTAYDVPVPAGGSYRLRLHMVEDHWPGPGRRVFDMLAEGRVIAERMDIHERVGAKYVDYLFTAEDIRVTDGRLTLTFVEHVDHPSISAMEIVRTG